MDKKKGGKPKLPALHIKFRQAQLAVTVIVPSIPGWIVHAKGYFPGVVNSTNQCAPGYSPWEVVERAVWFAIVTLCVIEFDAGFVNSTICPTFTVTAAGAHCSVSDALMMATGVPARWVPAFPALSDCTALLDDELLDDELELDELLLLLGVPLPHAATLITVAMARTPTAIRFLNDILYSFSFNGISNPTAIVADGWIALRR